MVGGRVRRLSCLLTYAVMLLLGVFLRGVEASGGNQVIHRKVGDSVELSSNQPTEGVSRATWKYGNTLVADKSSGVVPNNPFQGRVEFNNEDFTLTVKNLALQDSGVFSFTSEARRQQGETVTITLQVHEAVSTPSVKYDITKPDLTEVCRVSLDCSAAPYRNITYMWTVKSKTFNGSRLQHTITPQDGDTTFTCTASNVVSEMSASTSVRCSNDTSSFSDKGNFLLDYKYVLGAAGGGLLFIIIIIVVSVCFCRRKWSGSDSNELTVYADIADFSPELGPSDNSKPCSLYDTIENRNSPAQPMPQTIYDKIQIERMRKASVSPYQEVS